MKIVIDIPEKIYNDIRTKNEHGIIFNAVKNGTPVPEYLSKIKDEIEKERTFQRTMDEYDMATGLRKSLEIIDKHLEESESE